MPVTLSTIPKKTTKTKKQDDAMHTYKSNLNGPGPQPPSPESDATDDNEESTSQLETANATTNATMPSSKKKMNKLAERLEVNQLLSQLYPSNHMTQKVAALEALSSLVATDDAIVPTKRIRNRKATTVVPPVPVTAEEDPVAKAIIDNAFTTEPNEPHADNFKTPVSSPSHLTNAPNAPNAPKKSSKQSNQSNQSNQSKQSKQSKQS